MKRIVLFLITNLAVMLVLSVVLSVLGIGRGVGPNGIDLNSLLAFSLVVGFTGAIMSLLISKPMAKWSTGARVIDAPSSSTELWLVNTVRQLADRAGIHRTPEAQIFVAPAPSYADEGFQGYERKD